MKYRNNILLPDEYISRAVAWEALNPGAGENKRKKDPDRLAVYFEATLYALFLAIGLSFPLAAFNMAWVTWLLFGMFVAIVVTSMIGAYIKENFLDG
jgi:hypothetical protein